MNAPKRITLLSVLMLLALSEPAHAHIVAARLGDFYAGALHPLTDLQDIVLWLALGLFAGAAGPARGRWLVVIMPLGLLAGFMTELTFGFGSVGTLGNSAIMVALGLLLATGRYPATPVLGATAFCLALTSGASNASGTVGETNVVLFAAGLALAGYVALTLTMALTVAFRNAPSNPNGGWRHIALRVCGSWIAAVGLMVGGFALKAATA